MSGNQWCCEAAGVLSVTGRRASAVAGIPGLRGGFTLIEVMIVVGLLGLVLATGLPSFVRARKVGDLHQAVRDLVAACSQARAQAILQSVPMELVIVAESGAIEVRPVRFEAAEPLASSGRPGGDASNEEPTPSRHRFTARLSPDVGIELLDVNYVDLMQAPEAHVWFFPNGTSDEFTIILHWRQEWRKISLESITALAEVEADPRKWR